MQKLGNTSVKRKLGKGWRENEAYCSHLLVVLKGANAHCSNTQTGRGGDAGLFSFRKSIAEEGIKWLEEKK